jgi:hypothetical protein
MEQDKDVFRFEDFIDVDKLSRMKSSLLKEGLFSEDEEEIDPSLNPYHTASVEDDGDTEDFENSIYYSGTQDEDKYDLEYKGYKDMLSTADKISDDGGAPQPPAEISTHSSRPYDNEEFVEESNDVDDDDYYKLYKDKAEEFVCDIAIEGVSQADTEVRLIVESDEWTLMFRGDVKNGKCVIPMKKLSILSEGQKGSIRLEVNADGTLFTPWEDEFVVKASKKVTVKVNESRSSKKQIKSNKPGVSVKVRK